MKLEAALPLERSAQDAPPPVSFFEFWPGWMFYPPVIAYCLLLGLRYGSPGLLTAANPRITSGGLCGESKIDILDQVQGEARALLARATSLLTDAADPSADAAAAAQAMAAAGLAFPVVAKPDIGCNGAGVRLIDGPPALARYLAAFPRGERVMLQAFVPFEGEAGIFYIRRPGAPRGRITSVTLKSPPSVTGDGRSTLRQLIQEDPRAGKLASLFVPRLEGRLHEVPRQGETVRLVFVGNHCKGSVFRDGTDHVTPALAEAIERFARGLPEFYFGRIDLRFDNLAALGRGEGFRVIEVNGAGSEATHVWDPRTRLLDAWRAQFFHYGEAYRIGAANRARGFRPTGALALLRLWQRQKRLMAAYPAND